MSKLRVKVISESAFTVQGHGVHTAFFELTKATKARDDTEVLVNSFGKADITHLHTVGPYALGWLLLGSGKKVISAHVVPDSFVGSLIGAQLWLPLAKIYLRWFYNRADVVLAVSDQTKGDLERLGITRPIEVFHNVIDVAQYRRSDSSRREARDALRLDAEGVVVVGNGQVQPRKRIDSFIKAAIRLPDIAFVWVGGMPFKKAAADSDTMQHLIDNAPKNVRFTGVVSLDDVRSYFLAADIFVSPSDQETFGLAVLEAAASDLPVVLRDIQDYDETFRAEAVMVNDDAFADAITKLIDDKEYYAQMVEKSRLIARRFDSVEGAKRLIEIYKKLI